MCVYMLDFINISGGNIDEKDKYIAKYTKYIEPTLKPTNIERYKHAPLLLTPASPTLS